MAQKDTPKVVRYRETQTTAPAGFDGVTQTLTRVVESEGPVPQGATETTDELSGWTIVQEPK